MRLFPELRRQILEDMLGTSYDAYVNFKKEPVVSKKRRKEVWLRKAAKGKEENFMAFQEHRQRIPLWRFLLQLLHRDSLSRLIQWTDAEQFKFKIKEPNEVAQLWGSIKDKSDMTYEKLGRAMRYYYGKNIIEKVSGMRYSYRFIMSRKTSRYLDRLVVRRSSIGSTGSTAESEASSEWDSEDCTKVELDASPYEERSASTASSPSSYLNEDYGSPKSSIVSDTNIQIKQEDATLLPCNDYNNSLTNDFQFVGCMEEEQEMKTSDECVWTMLPDTFMDLDDIVLLKNENYEDDCFHPDFNPLTDTLQRMAGTTACMDIFFSNNL